MVSPPVQMNEGLSATARALFIFLSRAIDLTDFPSLSLLYGRTSNPPSGSGPSAHGVAHGSVSVLAEHEHKRDAMLPFGSVAQKAVVGTCIHPSKVRSEVDAGNQAKYGPNELGNQGLSRLASVLRRQGSRRYKR